MTASKLLTLVCVTGALMSGAMAHAQQAPQSPQPAAAATPSTATQSPAPSVTTSSSTQKSAASTTGNGSQTTKVAASEQKAADSGAQLIKDARNAGFKPEMIRGTQMFCRTAIELGSSFPVRTCYDSDQVKIKIHEYQEQRNQLEQMHSTGFGVH